MDAERLTEAIDGDLTGRRDLDEALAGYENQEETNRSSE